MLGNFISVERIAVRFPITPQHMTICGASGAVLLPVVVNEGVSPNVPVASIAPLENMMQEGPIQ